MACCQFDIPSMCLNCSWPKSKVSFGIFGLNWLKCQDYGSGVITRRDAGNSCVTATSSLRPIPKVDRSWDNLWSKLRHPHGILGGLETSLTWAQKRSSQTNFDTNAVVFTLCCKGAMTLFNALLSIHCMSLQFDLQALSAALLDNTTYQP